MMWKLRRDFDVLVLHDLQDRQALGSLTTIMSDLSDTWDTENGDGEVNWDVKGTG